MKYWILLVLAWNGALAQGENNHWVAQHVSSGDTVQLLFSAPLRVGTEELGTITAGTVVEVQASRNEWLSVLQGGKSGWIQKKMVRRYYTPAECAAKGKTWEPDMRHKCPPTDSMVRLFDSSEDGPEYLFKVCVNYSEYYGRRSEYDWQARNVNIPGVCYRDSD